MKKNFGPHGLYESISALQYPANTTFVLHLYNVDPPSSTLVQHCINSIQMFCVCWEVLSAAYVILVIIVYDLHRPPCSANWWQYDTCNGSGMGWGGMASPGVRLGGERGAGRRHLAAPEVPVNRNSISCASCLCRLTRGWRTARWTDAGRTRSLHHASPPPPLTPGDEQWLTETAIYHPPPPVTRPGVQSATLHHPPVLTPHPPEATAANLKSS